MPVVSEGAERKRRRGHGWLLLLILPGLVLAFMIGTAVHPVLLGVGDTVLGVGGEWGPVPPVPSGWHTRDAREEHERWLQVGRWR